MFLRKSGLSLLPPVHFISDSERGLWAVTDTSQDNFRLSEDQYFYPAREDCLSSKIPGTFNVQLSFNKFIRVIQMLPWKVRENSQRVKMSLSYLQLRLKQNEEDFAKISNIDLDSSNVKEAPKK